MVILDFHQGAIDVPVGSRSDMKQRWNQMEEVKAALFSPPFTFTRYRQGLPRVVGTFRPQRRRHGEEWLHPGCQGDLQEAQEAVRVQERQSVHGDQEATPLSVHQGGFPVVRSCTCYTAAMFDSLVIMSVSPVITATIAMTIPQSVSGRPAVRTELWSCV